MISMRGPALQAGARARDRLRVVVALFALGCVTADCGGAPPNTSLTPAPLASSRPEPPKPVERDAPVPVPPAHATMPPNVPEELALPVRDPRFFKRPHRPVSVITFELDARMRSLAAPEIPGGVDPNVLLEIAGLHAELARVTPTSTREHDEARAHARAEYVRYGGLVPGSDGADSAAYFGALEYELDGDRVVARAAYQALLTQTPNAWTAPYCHVGLAELLVREYPMARDQALAHYVAALRQLRRGQDLYPYVLLRIFQSQRALGDTKAATRTRERLESEFPHSEATKMATGE